MKNPKENKHHNDLLSTHTNAMNRYFGGNEPSKKTTCNNNKKCNCKCTTCNMKKCECNCNDCHCNKNSNEHCCG